MATTLTRKSPVTILKRMGDADPLLPDTAVEFSMNAAGELAR